MPLNDSLLAKSLNISTIAYKAIQTRLVSYVELDTILSLEDALNIIEIDQVAKYNEKLLEDASNG